MPKGKRYCPNCGAPRSETARFCEACAHPLAQASNSSLPAPAVSAPVEAAPTNWKVIVGDQLPPPQIVASRPPQPSQQNPSPAPVTAVKPTAATHRSLRGPAISLFITTGIEIATSLATNNGIAQQAIVYRGGLAVLNLFAGLIAGPRRGVASVIMLLGSLVLALMQGASLYSFADQILANPSIIQGLLPNVATQGLACLTALRTALASRK
jgi:hypothetical protein